MYVTTPVVMSYALMTKVSTKFKTVPCKQIHAQI